MLNFFCLLFLELPYILAYKSLPRISRRWFLRACTDYELPTWVVVSIALGSQRMRSHTTHASCCYLGGLHNVCGPDGWPLQRHADRRSLHCGLAYMRRGRGKGRPPTSTPLCNISASVPTNVSCLTHRIVNAVGN